MDVVHGQAIEHVEIAVETSAARRRGEARPNARRSGQSKPRYQPCTVRRTEVAAQVGTEFCGVHRLPEDHHSRRYAAAAPDLGGFCDRSMHRRLIERDGKTCDAAPRSHGVAEAWGTNNW